MNSTTIKNSKICLYFCSSMLLTVGLIALTIDLIQIFRLEDIKVSQDSYRKTPQSNYRCSDLCYYQCYQQSGDVCCYYGSSKCVSKGKLISQIILSLMNQQNNVEFLIKVLSIISGILFLLFIGAVILLCKKQNRQIRQVQSPLLTEKNKLDVNISEESMDNIKKINNQQESFAKIDQCNTCCICLEELNNQKRISLDCGHIYHSTCLQDWSEQQVNCPVCRPNERRD